MPKEELPRQITSIAVDFDGTICTSSWPEVGEPLPHAIRVLRRAKDSGIRLILWTNRSGKDLQAAINLLNSNGLVFDKINEPLDEDLDWCHSPKVYADMFIDDRAFGTYRKVDWLEIERFLEETGSLVVDRRLSKTPTETQCEFLFALWLRGKPASSMEILTSKSTTHACARRGWIEATGEADRFGWPRYQLTDLGREVLKEGNVMRRRPVLSEDEYKVGMTVWWSENTGAMVDVYVATVTEVTETDLVLTLTYPYLHVFRLNRFRPRVIPSTKPLNPPREV